ncbi:chorismate mutase [Candidatus Peregrinibacteria bacterium]|nr:chorismate mutase [Candidatus Peregrinibacteria bacterium]
MNNTSRLAALRKEVSGIDKQILALLGKRFKITDQIQQIKLALGLKITQQKRENELLNKYIRLAVRKKLNPTMIRKLFTMVFSYSKKSVIIKGK